VTFFLCKKKVTKEKAPQRNSPFGVRCGARENPKASQLAALKHGLASLRIFPALLACFEGVKNP
jgi:hypothetical protein